jgi:type I restriction enzyme S subunit
MSRESGEAFSASTPALVMQFERLAGAPGAVVRLRELILALAVQGKLVPQEESDGSAAVLLERSRSQVRTKMEEGKTKKEKPAAAVDTAETPFAVPDTWQWCRLTDTGEFINGLAFKPTDWAPHGLPIIRIQNLSGRNQEFNRTRGSFHPSVIVRSGDILVSWSATLDAFIWQGETGVLNQHIFRVEPAPCVDRGFLYWLLKWAIRDLAESEHAHGLVMSHINRGPFLAKPIALPPIAEQARIVARVDELMRLCDAIEAKGRLEAEQHTRLLDTLLGTLTDSATSEELAANWQRVAEHFDLLLDRPEALDALEQTILQLAVRGALVRQDAGDKLAKDCLEQIEAEKDTLSKIERRSFQKAQEHQVELFEIPDSWAWCTLQKLAVSGPTNGLSPRPIETPSAVRCLSLSATTQGYFQPEYFKYVDIDPNVAKPFLLKNGDLLLQRGNSLEYVGVAAIYDGADDQFIYPDLMMKIRLSTCVDAQYVHLWLISEDARDYFRRHATGTQGTMPKVNQSVVSMTPIPLPPAREQARIVARVTDLRRLCADLRQRLAASQATQSRLAEALVKAATA